MVKRWTIGLLVLATVTAACASGDDDEAASPPDATAPPAAAGTEQRGAAPTDATATANTSGETAPVPQRGGVLRYGEALGPSRFDAHRSTIGQDIRLLAPVYDRLVHFDAEGALVPGLAREWSFDDTGTVFTMKLRE